MDGKLLLVTNVKYLTPRKVLQRYKSLADIARGFRVLKSEIEIAPVFHLMPHRIKALKLDGSPLSPEAALSDLRRIQRHTVSIDSGTPIHGVSTVQPRQAEALAALRIKKPTLDTQLSLL